MKRFMIRSLLTAAVVGATAYVAEAGPLGLFGHRRCRCECECQPTEAKATPVRDVVQWVEEKRPVATCVGGVCHAVGDLIESKPVITFVKGGVSACANGQCPKR